MNVTDRLKKVQEDTKSMICLGLDLDPKRIPSDYNGSLKSIFDFAHRIIDATSDMVCAYKPNMAFFESMGADGFSLLKLIIERIPDNIPVILDGKRNDIGNTASHYAKSAFEELGATWVTINPYMGYDSIRPFLEYKENGVFILCLTSNSGAKDFQMLNVDGKPLYQIVAEKVDFWNKEANCGLVVGATQPEELLAIRKIANDMPILIPGVGAQGGSLEMAVKNGTANFSKPAIINVSRSVLYASSGPDFAKKARAELQKLNDHITFFRTGNLQKDGMPVPPESLPSDDSAGKPSAETTQAPPSQPTAPTQPIEATPPTSPSQPTEATPPTQPTPPSPLTEAPPPTQQPDQTQTNHTTTPSQPNQETTPTQPNSQNQPPNPPESN